MKDPPVNTQPKQRSSVRVYRVVSAGKLSSSAPSVLDLCSHGAKHQVQPSETHQLYKEFLPYCWLLLPKINVLGLFL